MTDITQSDVERTLKTMASTALRNEKYFSDLDAAAGDADFGVSLASGFRVIERDWDQLDKSSIGALLLKASMIITSNVGGCSGPIWGTAFMRAGALSREKNELTLADIDAMLTAAIEGIKKRGGAEIGDKTLLDSLAPIHEVVKEYSGRTGTASGEVLKQVTRVANDAIEQTKNWVAKRGRQSFTGERSVGTPDPGIVAIATMLNDLCKEFGVNID
jgi:phosphoenolpyruvate---glycerone phosphotransferase subunit DhaL